MNLVCTTVITQEGKWFVARCVEFGVVSQGKTIEEAEKNLREAVELFVEDQPRMKRQMSGRAPIVSTLRIKHG